MKMSELGRRALSGGFRLWNMSDCQLFKKRFFGNPGLQWAAQIQCKTKNEGMSTLRSEVLHR